MITTVFAAERLLKAHGYELLERGFGGAKQGIDIIARDDDCIVLVDVTASDNEEFPALGRASSYRKHFERNAIKYAMKHPEADGVTMRYDRVHLLMLGDDRFLVRHHINVVSTD